MDFLQARDLSSTPACKIKRKDGLQLPKGPTNHQNTLHRHWAVRKFQTPHHLLQHY